MKKSNIKLSLIFIVSLVLLSCNNKKEKTYLQDSGEIFHTYYNIKYEYDRPLTKEILGELNKFDQSLNPFKENTIITKVNQNQDITPDSLFMEVFNKSKEISAISEGLFDITCAPLVNAWGFGFKNMDNVSPEQIDSLREFVGYDKISLQGGRVVKTDPRVQINTSAIAKGFSVDIVARFFDSMGIGNYMCEIGGEVRAKGMNPKGECWHIGIDKPDDEKNPGQRNLQTIIKVCDKSVATSGNYRNFYIKDGKKYAHTINPKTGYPALSHVLSATVIADDCMTADAYATTFMLTDIEKALSIAENQKIDIYLIYSNVDGNIETTYSKGFEKYFIE